MEPSRLLECLAGDYARLRLVAARDLTAEVPSCPGWTVSDLVHHVAEVYLHKTECMRQQVSPEPWPPAELALEEPIPLLERAYAALTAQFAARAPGDVSPTWHQANRTVGFWIRRMAQETVIHRIDAELALGEPVAAIPADLAVDGIDEVLTLFVGHGSHAWAEDFGPTLAAAIGYRIRVRTEGRSWAVTTSAGGAEITADGADPVDATIAGDPASVLRWLWARGAEDAVTVEGEHKAVTELRAFLAAATL